MNDKKIKLFADGLKIDQFDIDFGVEVDGYTFNPSIFKNHGAKDYLNYSKELVSKSKNKPISLEVFADSKDQMIEQAKILNDLGNNIFVKIPITYTNQKYTTDVLEILVKNKIQINLTAIFTHNQIKRVLPILKDTQTILSVFAGRIYDSGVDASKTMQEICDYVNDKSDCEVLWASPRMPYDYISAINVGAKIITMQPDQIKKIKFFGKNLDDYSLETAKKQFFDDANSSGFKNLKNKDLKSNNLTYIINEIEYTINKLVLKHSSLKPKFKSKSKSKIDPVTSLDKIIEKSVVKIIEKNFPNHSIIGEELDQKLGKSEYKWIIDPLDGTKNYILGIPTWSNLVGLQKKINQY